MNMKDGTQKESGAATLDAIISLCKRRGFIFQSSEIYGGIASAWDYGPLGVELKRLIQQFWWRRMVQLRDDIVGLDAAILMHPLVWEASGHVSGFVDLLVEDTVTNERFRWDHLPEENRRTKTSPAGNPLSEPRQFNLMFKTHIGALEERNTEIFLRPETAQGIYVNFRNVAQTTRLKVPFGIAQVGKAFRNEIVTKRFIFRTCEFEQMEMQYFVHPNDASHWFEFWKEERMRSYEKLGIMMENLRFDEHGQDELAHYATKAFDIQYQFPFGWQELEGIHNRADWDLSQHMKLSKKDLTWLDDSTTPPARYTPHIIETSAGLTRTLLMVLCDAYEEQQLDTDSRVVLHLHPSIAPITAGVFPLVKKDGLAELARKIELGLREEMSTFYDQGGAIGRRYRRQDEIGTPFCITVDHETKETNHVTIRNRDTMEQQRVLVTRIGEYIREATKQYSRNSN